MNTSFSIRGIQLSARTAIVDLKTKVARGPVALADGAEWAELAKEIEAVCAGAPHCLNQNRRVVESEKY